MFEILIFSFLMSIVITAVIHFICNRIELPTIEMNDEEFVETTFIFFINSII